MTLDARAALLRLREGNARFASNVRSVDALLSQLRRADLSERQQPFAIILGCSDSRAPAEIVFDQGLGDLFVIRVAGNIVAPSQVGSVEFAADAFGTRLVVVMGHTSCGAVEAAMHEPSGRRTVSSDVLSIVDRVRPAVEEARSQAAPEATHDEIMDRAVRANVHRSCAQLRATPALRQLIETRGVLIVGACYDLASGKVDFFDEP